MNYNISYKKYQKKFIYKDLGFQKREIQYKVYKYFIIIPIYNEYHYILDTLQSIHHQNKLLLKETLVILVINNSKDCSLKIINYNSRTHALINKQKYNYKYEVLDYYSKNNAIHKNFFGVGLARKIGMDYCLQYASKNSLLFCLDADTIISKNYLEIIVDYYMKNGFKVCNINFKHQQSNDANINRGIRIYEKALYNMAQRIKSCRSPYGYVSLGSTIICTLKAYIACGGMSKKKATEDFYFLQALAKHTPIKKIKNILVFPSSRNNQRVYLGTGFRMKEYKKNKEFKYLNYSKKSFKKLKNLISLVDASWNKEYNIFLSEIMKILDKKIIEFLIEKKIETVWNNIRKNSKNKNQFMHFFHQWFDALTIIQFLKKLNN